MQDSDNRSGQLQQRVGSAAGRKKSKTPEVLITKLALVKNISENQSVPLELTRTIVDDFLMMVSCALVTSCKVRLDDFGTLALYHTDTGYGPCSKVSFQMGKRLKILASEARGNH